VKSKLNPTLVGAFVLGAIALTVAALLSLRSWHLFSKPGYFVAYFNESVQGLDSGSAVKLRGVRVGRVATIRVQYDSKARRARVVVVAEVDPKVVSDAAGGPIPITDRATLERLVVEGLRAKIDLVGITGLQYVELDFVDPLQFPAPHFDDKTQYAVVPTLRSGMSELVANVSKIVNNVNKIDFAGISQDIKSFLASAKQQVGGLDLKNMVAKVTAAAASIEDFASSAEAKKAFASLNKTAADAQGLIAKLDIQVEPVGAELARTLRSFRDAAEDVRKFLGPQTGLGEEAARTLRQLTETAESLQELADFLERNPSALLTGKKRPSKSP
jgi:paraquat-inducible protein B